jgi:GntR family transcriptional regulator/MocR family aminotransferase
MTISPAPWLRVEPNEDESLPDAVARVLRDAITRGELRTDATLPSSRELAEALSVSRNVAVDAYAQLEADGYLRVQPRRAPKVAAVPGGGRATVATATARSDAAHVRFDFTPTAPDISQFPRRDWASATTHAVKTVSDDELDYGDPRGNARLRAALAAHIARTRGVVADPSRIVILQGTAHGVDLLLGVLSDRGVSGVTVENPSLTTQHARVRRHRLALHGAAVDAEGLVVDDVSGEAVIVTAAHQFPTGVVLSGARRRALLRWATTHNGVVIEDDYDGDLRYDRKSIGALQGFDPDRVVYIGTVSKTLAPAVRLGWMVLPESLVVDVVDVKRQRDGSSAGIEQPAFLRLLESGAYDKHVHRIRTIYRRRRARLAAALNRALPHWTVQGAVAGVHLAVRLPDGMVDAQVAACCGDAGITVHPMSRYALGRVPSGLVLGYTRIADDRIDDAVAAVAETIRTV